MSYLSQLKMSCHHVTSQIVWKSLILLPVLRSISECDRINVVQQTDTHSNTLISAQNTPARSFSLVHLWVTTSQAKSLCRCDIQFPAEEHCRESLRDSTSTAALTQKVRLNSSRVPDSLHYTTKSPSLHQEEIEFLIILLLKCHCFSVVTNTKTHINFIN